LQNERIFDKIQERLCLETAEKLNLSFKDFSNIIWSISSSRYAPKYEDLYDLYENYIELKAGDITLEDLSFILWAIVDKVRIKLDTYIELENIGIRFLAGLMLNNDNN
jgi:hypothetical protein